MTQVINTACLSLPARPGKPKPGLETGREVLCLVGEAAQRPVTLSGFAQDAGESVQCPNQIGFKRSRILLGKPTINLDSPPNSIQRTHTITHLRQPIREIVHVDRPLGGGHVLFLVAAHCCHSDAAQIRVPRRNRFGYFGCWNIHSGF